MCKYTYCIYIIQFILNLSDNKNPFGKSRKRVYSGIPIKLISPLKKNSIFI